MTYRGKRCKRDPNGNKLRKPSFVIVQTKAVTIGEVAAFPVILNLIQDLPATEKEIDPGSEAGMTANCGFVS